MRQIKRIKSRVIKEGPKGITHGNKSKSSNNRMSEQLVKKIESIVKERYPDFGPTLAKEKLEENHKIKIGKENSKATNDWLGIMDGKIKEEK